VRDLIALGPRAAGDDLEHQSRIFVVDDEPLSREVLVRRLAASGFGMLGLPDAASCLAEVDKELPDLILLDVSMPEVSGLDLLRQLRQRWAKQQLPVILVTALMDSDDVVMGLDAGANDFIVKPVTMPVLIARMEVCLDIGRANRERDKAKVALQAALDTLEQRVQQRTAELAAANRNLLNEVADRTRAEERLLAYQNQLRMLASRLAAAQEEERKRIAAGLHDDIGTLLALMRMKLGSGDASAPELTKVLDDAIRITRSLTFELGSRVVYDFGLEAALEGLVDEFQKRHGIATTLQNDEHPKPLDVPTRIAAFRAVRELLHNVVKHARASSVTVSIWRQGDRASVRVADNGIGFDASSATTLPSAAGGYGLFNIRERISGVGGSTSVQSKSGDGTQVTLTVPIMADSTAAPPSATAVAQEPQGAK
jgi:signal transduction histidine kinase